MAATDTAMDPHVDAHHHENGADWSGGKEPFRISYGKLMMWYFLVSDAFTFAGFLIAYGALRFSSPSWPVPDFVFKTAPFGIDDVPLGFVTIMSFLLIISSVTMVRGVQEGHRENKKGALIWVLLTALGGLGFLSCQAWEWTNLIATEHMSVTRNPFGTHTEHGIYLNPDGSESKETFINGKGYLIHKFDPAHAGGESHGEGHGGEHVAYEKGDHPGYFMDAQGFVHRKFKVTEGVDAGKVKMEEFGPKAFGALFFFITGFHGFHVFTGVLILLIVAINIASGLYVERRNGYEMVEKIGLYWHFVDLVWVFVFLVFYLL
ncbi:MAG: cytochrome c oxidase subunit 3 [Haliscomenobacter sp.]|nr:cytochrome c oxidase subunit 3 [Haliscomenobacter sp.]